MTHVARSGARRGPCYTCLMANPHRQFFPAFDRQHALAVAPWAQPEPAVQAPFGCWLFASEADRDEWRREIADHAYSLPSFVRRHRGAVRHLDRWQ
jgi:hypothetical protein